MKSIKISDQYERGSSYEYETRGGKSSKSSNVNSIFNAAKGPGDYHGTMRKDELEREAGGKIFASENEETRQQVENTRYRGKTTSTRVASGATETKLTDDEKYHNENFGVGANSEGFSGGNGYRSSYDYEKSFSSGTSSSSTTLPFCVSFWHSISHHSVDNWCFK